MNPDKPIPYHLWCCTCDDCLNGPVPYKLTDMGRTYPTPQYPAPKPRGDLTSVTPEGRKLEAAHKARERVRDKARRAG